MFRHAELKIERADKHVKELQSDIRNYIKEYGHTVRVEFDPHAGCDVLKLFAPDKPVPQEFALPIGDAIHNLHTALDFIWYEFVCMFSAPDRYIKFPFYETRDQVASAIAGRKVPQPFATLVDYILDDIQPYKGGKNALWELHDLDITDKHGYLIPRVSMISIWGIRAESKDGTELSLPPVRTVVPGFPPAVFRFHGQRDVKITDHGKMTVSIIFWQGPLEGHQVEQILVVLTKAIAEILEGFRSLVELNPL
jgi:hypothetical protein